MVDIFKYTGRDQKGNKVKGELKANNADEVMTHLAKQFIIPIDIKKSGKDPEKRTLNTLNIKGILQSRKVSLTELLNFCREMSALNGVGISIVDGIKQLAATSSSRSFANALSAIAEDLVAGQTLANALRKHPKIFSFIFTNIIEVGENTGNLNESFDQLSNYLENLIANRRRIASTTRYPVTVLVAAMAAAVAINILVVPKFTQIFQHFGGKLPITTRILVAFSDFLTSYWQILIALVIAIIIIIPYMLKKPRVRYLWDQYKLKIPIFGNIQNRVIISQFTWTFALVLRAGIEVIKGINLAGNSTGNSYFTQKIVHMREGLERGESMSTAASSIDIFPPAILQMIAVGEKSGRLDTILQAINVYYEKEIDYDIKRINELIEPILLVIVGVIVVVLALGVYLPMWDLIKVAQHG